METKGPIVGESVRRIGYLVASISRVAGGLQKAVLRLAQEVSARGPAVEVFSLADEWSSQDTADWLPIKPKTFGPSGPRTFGYASQLPRALKDASLDLLHVHGLWMFPSVAALRWRSKTGRPYVVSPHGMLDVWALRNSRFKKRIAAALFERRHLRNAACIHALSNAEATAIREYGLRNPICVIPNGIDLPKMESESKKIEKGRRTLLYLGRLHPKKNLIALTEAFAQIRNSEEWELIVAGWDQGGYENELRSRIADGGLDRSVRLVGPQFGGDKENCYRNCDAFILPSLSEGLPMVVLEAWAHAKPVLMTTECNLPEGFTAGAALRIGTDSASIAAGLHGLLEMTDENRHAMGDRGRALVSEKFSWPKIAEQMREVYSWVLGGGDPPETVKLEHCEIT
jgi:poly(glycerol-phosphate) alpha-glucosyltransferase